MAILITPITASLNFQATSFLVDKVNAAYSFEQALQAPHCLSVQRRHLILPYVLFYALFFFFKLNCRLTLCNTQNWHVHTHMLQIFID